MLAERSSLLHSIGSWGLSDVQPQGEFPSLHPWLGNTLALQQSWCLVKGIGGDRVEVNSGIGGGVEIVRMQIGIPSVGLNAYTAEGSG